ncbi:MAG TPA: hypothetical protein VKR53_04490 [Puia sp.]|nr:hypothetical protein [Puia sp.]
MHRKDLIQYLNEQMDSSDFKAIVSEEVQSFKKNLQIKGGSVPIIYDGDNIETKITYAYLKRLGEDFLHDQLDEYYISYIVDALSLSEHSQFESEELKEKFYALTDFEVNGHLTKSFMMQILNDKSAT